MYPAVGYEDCRSFWALCTPGKVMRRSETRREARQVLYPGNQVQKVMKAGLPLVRQKQEVQSTQRLRPASQDPGDKP